MADVRDIEAARYRRAATWGALVPMVVFAVSAAMQSEIFQIASGLDKYGEIYDVPLWARLVGNLTAAALIGLAVRFLPINPARRVAWCTALVGVAVGALLVRGAIQVTLGVYQASRTDLVLVDVVVGLLCALFSLAVGVTLAEAFQRVRFQVQAASRQALRASAALDALQAEELRVRREVAENLHGTTEPRLLQLRADLRGIIDDLPVGGTVGDEHVRRLTQISSDVEDIHEHGVREMGPLLYPEGVNVGLSHAVRMMLKRIPSPIRVQAHIEENVVEYDDPAFARVPHDVRLLVVRLLEEAVSNALRHGNASQIAVSLWMDDNRVLTMIVDDDGPGVPEEFVLAGLTQLRDQLHAIGGAIELDSGALGGARLEATVPLGAH